METYSASSVSSIFAKGAVSDENRSSVANRNTATTPPPVRRVCRSPFVTPNHPLYMFGDSGCTGSKPAAAPKKAKNCLESLQDMKISSPTREEEEQQQHQSGASPFRRLELSRAFDDDDDDHNHNHNQRVDTPHCRLRAPPQAPHRVLRKSNTFGMERIQELSMSIDSPLERKLHVIERDLEGEDGLSIRLRRMKRRLFLENVAGSPHYEGHANHTNNTGAIFFPTTPQPLDETRKSTPRHSNCNSNSHRSSPWPASHELLKAAGMETEEEVEGTMEGMEVVLEDPSSPIHHNEPNYLSFSSSSDSIQMEMEEEEDGVPAPHQKCLGDSSVVTEVTAACSTFGAGDEDHPHWVSLSSISEHE